MEIAVLVVPAEGVYHSAFPDFGGSEDNVTVDGITDFESLVQKRIVWAYFSNNWLEGIQFPELPVRIIHDQGIIPFIRMMARSSIGAPLPDPVCSGLLMVILIGICRDGRNVRKRWVFL
jgi:hypothetical protein